MVDSKSNPIFSLFGRQVSMLISPKKLGNALDAKDRKSIIRKYIPVVGKVVRAGLVHSSSVSIADQVSKSTSFENCDALITNNKNIILSITIGDCIPVVLFDEVNNVLSLVHAGWRGLHKEILTNAIDEMKKRYKTSPKKLNVYIGPHICKKHYPVGKDVANKFQKYPESLIKDLGNIFLDLSKVAKDQLIEVEVEKDNIIESKKCSFEDTNLYSHRRGERQRNLVAVWFN